MKALQIYPKPFIYVFFAFIACTVIGTLTHELGHIAVAQWLGYDTTLSYQSMHVDRNADRAELHRLADPYFGELRTNRPFPTKKAFEAKRRQMHHNDFLIRLGGPLQTMLTGSIGLGILLYRRRISYADFNLTDWLLVFLSLFWLRQPSNLAHGLARRIFRGTGSWTGGDEWVIAYYLKWPLWSVSVLSGAIGFVIAACVILFVIPGRYRVTFLIAGLLGGIAGFVSWMNYLGPYLLP
ncbi:hypothetical protein HYN48_08150 [Flavobacterium magnum]|uniref:Uncharacterized protein n=1 Tax=Flavobacterium magnum TaxID=2162713 RepID=A0A2S0RH50_9FLAO|nr:hypothetical protein [Flavobacterium magnum]AWA30052.1 hypothetical protein HYN48_08150 [Flavobacterium magnum]